MNNIRRKVLRAKIHRAVVTHADLHYEGSLTLPPHLMKISGIEEYEAVDIWNVTNGSRLETYAIAGRENSNFICANGAAAHLVKPKDLIIIASFCYIFENSLESFKPCLIFVDEENQVISTRNENPGPE